MRALAKKNEKGAAIIVALTFLAVLLIMTSAFISNLISSSNQEKVLEIRTKSYYLAEAGLNYALWKLDEQGDAYKGESGVSFEDGSFDVEIKAHPEASAKRIIVSHARLQGYPEIKVESEIRAVASLETLQGESLDFTMGK